MTKEIPLTRGLSARVSAEDFDRLSAHRWHAVPGRRTHYAATKINGKTVYMHRLVAGLVCEAVDHIDEDGLNNQRENLRPCSRGDNARRRWSPKTDAGTRGVWKKGSKFVAQIGHAGKFIYLGSFNSADEAANAYRAASLDLFGKFARESK